MNKAPRTVTARIFFRPCTSLMCESQPVVIALRTLSVVFTAVNKHMWISGVT